MIKNLILFILFFISPCFSHDIEFICDVTDVSVKFIGKWEETKVHITAKRNSEQTSLWLRSIDYANGRCISDKNDNPKIIINAYCGGSGCSEKTYVLIDASSLVVELIPIQGKSNLNTLEKILGKRVSD